MKILIVIRHAKSSWDDPELSDLDRPLNDRGERDAPKMARRLQEKDLRIDAVITSPSVRTLKTCDAFVDILGFPKDKVQVVKELYHAGDEIILNQVRKIDNKYNHVMIFGHNPGLTEFVNNFLEEEIENIPTCGVVCCRVRVKGWDEVKWGSGEMEFFDWPKRKT